MKGVILAGGTGSRLLPLTKVTNKHLLPVYNKPMIFYPIELLKKAGIKQILVVTGKHHAGDVFSLLGSGKEFGLDFTFRVQDEAGGIPQAMGLAKDFVGHEKFISVNGDNILFEDISSIVKKFEKGDEEAHILLYETTREEAKKAGVAIMDGDKVVKLVEKPDDPPTNVISIGIFMLTPSVFEVISSLKPSARGELEVVDIQNEYIRRGTLKASRIGGEWLDAGSIEELSRVNQRIAEIYQKRVIGLM